MVEKLKLRLIVSCPSLKISLYPLHCLYKLKNVSLKSLSFLNENFSFALKYIYRLKYHKRAKLFKRLKPSSLSNAFCLLLLLMFYLYKCFFESLILRSYLINYLNNIINSNLRTFISCIIP